MWNSINLACNLTRENCTIPQDQLADRDIIAILRSVLSSLSIIGTFSIIVSVIRGRQTCSPKIHPIFMLSVADFILAALWTAGGGIWLSTDPYHFKLSRKNCFVILIATVIVECVTVNLTCVYALLAYSSIRQRDFSNVYSLLEKDTNRHVWKPWKTTLVYVASWVTPVILILIPFAALDAKYGTVHNTDECTCWCVPYFGNLKPHADPMNKASAQYMYGLGVFVLAYSVVVAVHYIVGFVLLCVVYLAILARIRRMRAAHQMMTKNSNIFGATEAILIKGHSQAKTRVLVFLTVFIICSFFNLFLAVILVRYSSAMVNLYHTDSKVRVVSHRHIIPTYAMVAYIFQSITVPLQGFLNAIVYGWTRKDFVQAVDNRAGKQVPPPMVTQKKGAFFWRGQQEKPKQQEGHDRLYGCDAKETNHLLSGSDENIGRTQVISPLRKPRRRTLSGSSDSDTCV